MATTPKTKRNARIVAIASGGKTFYEIANELGVSRSLVAGVVARWGKKKTGDGPRSYRVKRAIELRSEGMTWRQIADHLGYSRPQAACSAAAYWAD